MFARKMVLILFVMLIMTLPAAARTVVMEKGWNPSWIALRDTGKASNWPTFTYRNPKTNKPINLTTIIVSRKTHKRITRAQALPIGTIVEEPDTELTVRSEAITGESFHSVCKKFHATGCEQRLAALNRISDNSKTMSGTIQVPLTFTLPVPSSEKNSSPAATHALGHVTQKNNVTDAGWSVSPYLLRGLIVLFIVLAVCCVFLFYHYTLWSLPIADRFPWLVPWYGKPEALKLYIVASQVAATYKQRRCTSQVMPEMYWVNYGSNWIRRLGVVTIQGNTLLYPGRDIRPLQLRVDEEISEILLSVAGLSKEVFVSKVTCSSNNIRINLALGEKDE